MFPVCYSYASVLLLSSVRYLYVTRMRILVCVSDLYVTRIYSYVTCMLLVSIRMLLVCYSYVFVCIRMLLVYYSFSYVSVWCFSQEIVTLLTTSYYLLLNAQAYGPRGRGGLQPPTNFGQLRFFGQREKIWANQFFKTFPCFLNHYFEEKNIFYFNLKLA